MDRVLFGDNQFFGVNHMSEEKARTQAMRFQDNAAVIEVLDVVYAEGIRTFMCTTHDRMAEICEHFRANSKKYEGFGFYPCMPYAHKYANAITEHGMLDAVRRFLPNEGLLDAAMRGGMSLAKKDIEGVATLLVDAEMKMFAGLRTDVIFLQNVVTDLLLGLGFDEAFRIFDRHVRDRYGAEPGFITMNLPRLLPALERVGIHRPIICANVNKIAFRMCGGREEYARLIESGRCRTIAMSVLASGALSARDALEYVCGLRGLESIVFGASSSANIRQTRQLIEELDAVEPPSPPTPMAFSE